MDDDYIKKHFGNPPVPEVVSHIPLMRNSETVEATATPDIARLGAAIDAIAKATKGMDKEELLKRMDRYLEDIKEKRLPIHVGPAIQTSDYSWMVSIPITDKGIRILLEDAVIHIVKQHDREAVLSSAEFAGKIQLEVLAYLQAMLDFQESNLEVDVTFKAYEGEITYTANLYAFGIGTRVHFQ